MNNSKVPMTQEMAKELAGQIFDLVRNSKKPMSLKEIAERLDKPFIHVEVCADRLLEAGRIDYKPISGLGKFGFIHKKPENL